jgi:hypothetical protein
MLQFVPKSLWAPSRRNGSVRPLIADGEVFEIHDTLRPPAAATDDAREVINNIAWQPESFTATATLDGDADMMVRFPSPLPQGNDDWDTAIMDWHFARDKAGRPCDGPAMIVLDILQGGNLIAGFIAKTLAKAGIHGLVLHLPQSGLRRKPREQMDWSAFLPSLRQGAADARRARDVVASLPTVTGAICLQGTSLGSFVATLAGAIDGAFDSLVLALSGGDVNSILTTGKMDAVRVRQSLRQAGYDDQKLKDWLWNIEPLRVAHQLDAKKTWLFSARHDQVVPAANTKKLADAIGLDWHHHRQLAGCHYTCIMGAHRFLKELVRAVPR